MTSNSKSYLESVCAWRVLRATSVIGCWFTYLAGIAPDFKERSISLSDVFIAL